MVRANSLNTSESCCSFGNPFSFTKRYRSPGSERNQPRTLSDTFSFTQRMLSWLAPMKPVSVMVMPGSCSGRISRNGGFRGRSWRIDGECGWPRSRQGAAAPTAEPLQLMSLTDVVVDMVGGSPLVHQAIGMVRYNLTATSSRPQAVSPNMLAARIDNCPKPPTTF